MAFSDALIRFLSDERRYKHRSHWFCAHFPCAPDAALEGLTINSAVQVKTESQHGLIRLYSELGGRGLLF